MLYPYGYNTVVEDVPRISTNDLTNDAINTHILTLDIHRPFKLVVCRQQSNEGTDLTSAVPRAGSLVPSTAVSDMGGILNLLYMSGDGGKTEISTVRIPTRVLSGIKVVS